MIKALRDRSGGGYELLAFRGAEGEWRDVRSDDINEYLKQVTGGDWSAKDFRTWNATVLAAVSVALHEGERDPDKPLTKTSRKRIASRATKSVAAYLGNTPAVCRASYIDPRVFDRFDSGETIHDRLVELGGSFDPGKPTHRLQVEEAVLELIG